jgi:hypothetical protein
MTPQYQRTLRDYHTRLRDDADYSEGRAERWPIAMLPKEEDIRQQRVAELHDFAQRCRLAAAHFEVLAEASEEVDRGD